MSNQTSTETPEELADAYVSALYVDELHWWARKAVQDVARDFHRRELREGRTPTARGLLNYLDETSEESKA